jgi:uncharacterized protein
LKRIALLSDTHSFLDPSLSKYFSDCHEIWHAGDIGTIETSDQLASIKPLRAVYGNIDGAILRRTFSKNLSFFCEGVNVFMTHIGGSPGRYIPEVKKLLLQHQPNLFICGHSHILKVMFDKSHNMLFMNPGACGNIGIHTVKTMLRFSIDGIKIKDLEIIEIKK